MLTPEENAIRYHLYNQGLFDKAIAERVGVNYRSIAFGDNKGNCPLMAAVAVGERLGNGAVFPWKEYLPPRPMRRYAPVFIRTGKVRRHSEESRAQIRR